MKSNWSHSLETLKPGKIGDLLSRVNLKIDVWPWKTIGHLSYAASNFVRHFIANGEFKLELQSGNAQFGSKSTIFKPRDLEIWRMTLKNNRVPLLSNMKLCASFHHHMWIQTGVTVRKRLHGVMTSVTLTFDLWPLPFAWTSCLSMVIQCNSWKFQDDAMTGTLSKRCGRRTDGQTDRRADGNKCS